MLRRIAFLRAVNVGKRTVGMACLAEICRGLGYDDVWTYINSGNVVFTASGSRTSIEHRLGRALQEAFGFEVTTFVRLPAELEASLQLHPFEVADGDTYFITFLTDTPSAATVRSLEAASNEFDTLVVHGCDVHWRMRGRSTDTKLTRATWSVVGHNASTSRNVTMLRKLLAKLKAEPAS